MKKRVCTTYLSVDWDTKKNSEPIRMERKEEIERLIIDDIGMQPIWQQHQWILARQDHDSKNINEMLRKTLSGLFGKESAIKELQDRFQVQAVLRIVFYFDKNKYNPEIVDILIKKYGYNVKFSAGIEPYVTLKLSKVKDDELIEKIKEFLRECKVEQKGHS